MKHYLEVLPIKALLYDILAGAVDEKTPEIIMGQQMGVAMSSAVLKEKGVLNIQVQNVAVKTIMVKVTEALKMLDSAMLDSPVIETLPEPDLLEAPEEKPEIAPENDLDIIMDQHLQGAVRLDEFLSVMSGRYVEAALEHFNNKKGVVQTHLGVSNMRLNRIMTRCGIQWQR